MPDMEKVIKGLKACAGRPHDCVGKKCPYFDTDECRIVLEKDALELLKEYQEAKPLIDAISDSVHETAKMFRQNDGLKHYDDGSSEP